MSTQIRPAESADAAPLTEIYDHYVRHTAITFDVEPWTLAQRAEWLRAFSPTGRHRIVVAEESGRVLGWACTRRFREKAAYDTTVESSIYLAPDAVGRGVGSALYGALFDALPGAGVHRVIAGITLPNDASSALHTRFGFQPVGVMREVGFKLGRYWDVLWMERALD